MTIEIVLALLENLKCAAAAICAIAAIVFGIWLFVSVLTENMDEFKNSIKKHRRWAILLLFLVLLSCIPSMEDVWKVRISIIKFELASPGNVQASVNTIERIARELECKYLKCPSEKKVE